MASSPTDAELADRAGHHPPSAEAARRHKLIADLTTQHMIALRDLVPFSREQSLALTAVEEASMWANKGVARNHDKLVEEKTDG